MIIAVTLLAIPIGLVVKSRVWAYLSFAVLFAHVFTFQTATLVLEWVNGATDTFPTDFPGGNTLASEQVWGYFAFATFVYLVGFGLLTLSYWLRNRSRRRAAAGVEVGRAVR